MNKIIKFILVSVLIFVSALVAGFILTAWIGSFSNDIYLKFYDVYSIPLSLQTWISIISVSVLMFLSMYFSRSKRYLFYFFLTTWVLSICLSILYYAFVIFNV